MRVIVFLLVLLASLSATVVPLGDLIEHGRRYEGKEVTIVGEVIGESMRRGAYTWLNVLGVDGVAVGVYIPNTQARQMRYYGDYAHRGDEVAVTGVFKRFDRKHEGETMVWGQSLEVVTPGYRIKHTVGLSKIMLATGLSLITFLLGLLTILIKQEKPK
jgi:hypothetical protein